ncbi:helix-turn-helix domain-containing protein [Cognatilysobacter segetis]|uniref:helix-turn-helix domain-containing protein n=1 Tax=Cognatilysobacter segetis TaxID=2492394 RepID=UPI00105B203B|nr:helix-turn-helix transcriptional regulator [Lysobacter segetis]
MRLRQARERAGITQQELGVRVGVDESVAGPRINQYENGVHQPRQEMVLELANALGVPAAYLSTKDELLARLLLAWPNLTAEQRRKYAERAEADAVKVPRPSGRTTRPEAVKKLSPRRAKPK